MNSDLQGKFSHYRKAKKGETSCGGCSFAFTVWYRKGLRCGDWAYHQPVGKLMTCDAAQPTLAPDKGQAEVVEDNLGSAPCG